MRVGAALADRDVKISPDPLLIDKIRDVVGLYLAPPANAAVFSMDEKPQIQALERTAPVLPMIPGVPERRSFDYVRHGTVDLFAALNIATGKVIGKLSAQHRAVDFRDFLDQIDRQVNPALTVHVICDNLSTHKAPVVHRWLLAHPRFVLHFTPTYSSWINQVERWLAELQRRAWNAACSAPSMTSPPRSTSGSSSGTKAPGPSNGPRPLTRSSTVSAATFTHPERPLDDVGGLEVQRLLDAKASPVEDGQQLADLGVGEDLGGGASASRGLPEAPPVPLILLIDTT